MEQTTSKETKRTEREENSLGNLIWDELKRILMYKTGLQRYTDRQRATNRWANLIIAIVAITGAALSPVSQWIPIGVLILILVAAATCRTEILSLLQPEEELAKLDSLYNFYNRHFVQHLTDNDVKEMNKMAAHYSKLYEQDPTEQATQQDAPPVPQTE